MEKTIELFKDVLFKEVKAGAIYSRAAEITQNDEARMLFLELSSEEDDHARNLFKKAKGTPLEQGSNFDDYVKSLESSPEGVIPKEDLDIIQKGEIREVLKLASNHEKETMEAFMALAEKEDSREVKDFYLEFVRTEKEHLNSLNQMLNSLGMEEDERPAL